jgi:uncharacterized protein (TIGR02147 family)
MKKNAPAKINIYKYLEYREFLRDFYESRKQCNDFYSYRYMAMKVGMDHSTLVRVLLSKRHISIRAAERFIALCGLSERQGEYFLAMVNFSKAKNDKQARLYFEKMLALKQRVSRKLENYQYEYFQKWYYAVIRSLLEIHDFKGDYKALAQKLSPSISVPEAKQAVELLERLKLIKKNSRGKYELSDPHVTISKDIPVYAVKAHQKQTIMLAAESLEHHHKDFRDISSITLAIDRDRIQEIKERIKACRDGIIKLLDDVEKPECVYQVNFQLVPVSHLEGWDIETGKRKR